MAIRLSKGLQLTDLSKVVYFKRYYFVPTFGVPSQPFYPYGYYCSARVVHGCIAGGGVPCYWARPLALYRMHSMLRGNSSM